MKTHGIEGIDLAVINLYPFEEVRAAGGDYPTTVENIDIGGPAMIRASAKNHAYVTTLTDPADYAELLEQLSADDGKTAYAFRQRMAAKAYARTAAYDAMISNWFAEALSIDTPRHRVIGGALKEEMRYGENPHQKAAFYVTGEKRPGVSTAALLGASSSPTTISTIRMRPTNSSPSSCLRRRRPARSSSTPIPAASPPDRA